MGNLCGEKKVESAVLIPGDLLGDDFSLLLGLLFLVLILPGAVLACVGEAGEVVDN